MATYGVVSTINPPMLSSIKQPSLIKFEVDYVAYKDKVADVNRTRNEEEQLIPASIRQCVKPELLQSLCIIGEIIGATTVEEATDENVKEWFDARLTAAPKDISERVRSAIDSVTYKQCKQDPSGAAMEFVLNIITALDKNNASEVVQESEKSKSLINRLIHKLEPAELVVRLNDERAYWSSSDKSNLQFFMKRISALAVEVHNGEMARAKVKKKTGQAQSSRGGGTKRPNFDKGDENPTNKKKPKTHQGKSDDPKRGTVKTWDQPCLNKEECDGIHRIKDCPKTSEKKKKELLDAYWKERKAAKAVRNTEGTSGYEHPDADSGRYRVKIDDAVDAVALGDSGSDFSAITTKILKQMILANPKLKPETLAKPMELQTAINGSAKNQIRFTASQSVSTSITLLMPDSELPVRVRGVDFIVVDQDMDEVLLGRPFLKAIGFNLRTHLEEVGQSIHNRHVDELTQERGRIMKAAYSGMSYRCLDDDPIAPTKSISTGFGTDSESSMSKAFEEIISDGRNKGLSDEGENRLKAMMKKFRNIFRIQLGHDQPAKVTPLLVKPVPNAHPHRSPQRRYAPNQREFLCNTVSELVEIGAIFKNPSSRWASPALAVPKPGSDKLRLTVDLRGPNSKTQPIQSAMPHLESRLQECQGSSYFAKIDFCHGYWQIPLHQNCQEMFSIQTPLGVYTPTRVLQGGTDSGNHFQSVTQESFGARLTNVLQWLDDFLIHAESEVHLLDTLEVFMTVCMETGFKLHAEKCQFFLKEAKFCGRIISATGVRHDPRKLEAMLNMKNPTTGAELQQLLCATNWMRTSIPSYSELIAPLHDLLEKAYTAVGSRTRKAVRRYNLRSSWGPNHDQAFAKVKKQLAASTELAHPNPDCNMCLFTDASESHWAAILTQVSKDDQRKPIEDQNHQPLCFLSGCFKGSAANWSVPEKEGFAIVEGMCRLDYLISGHVVSIFTDHANLVYLYDPIGRNPGIPRHTASKLTRWALKLSEFRYIIDHVEGDRNVWADMLTRWAVRANQSVQPKNSMNLKSLMLAPVNPGINPKLDWPSMEEVRASQVKSDDAPPSKFDKTPQGVKNQRDVYWIPNNDEVLKLRILIAAHVGMGGHRGWQTTKTTVAAHFWWAQMDSDIKAFVHSCLHCLATHPAKVIPRPLGHGLHASKPNKLLHFDFCFMTPGEEGLKYVLILKDDHSGYVWLQACSDTTAETAASTFLKWFTTFGTVHQWVSDRGPHFKNELVKHLRESTKAHHHFTLAYCPWSNGTVEVVCRELLRATRALLSEFQLPVKAWPTVLPIVQSALNNSPLQRLSGHCPLTALTGLPQDNPLLSIKTKEQGVTKIRNISELRARQVTSIRKLQDSLDQMHKSITANSDAKRKSAVDCHNRKTGVRPINFDVGDFVLRGILQREVSSKPSLKWKGPFRVTECRSEYIFQIEDLITGGKQDVHGRRLKFFRNSSFEIDEEIRDHLAYQQDELLVIEDFEDIRERSGVIEIAVKWMGFDKSENDWVEFSTLREDVPEMLEDFITSIRSHGTPRQRKIASSI